MKKIVSLLLSVCLIFMLSASAFAARFPANGFPDVSHSAWYSEAVNFAKASGLMVGVNENRFEPKGTVTRAMVTTVLYSLAHKPNVNGLSNPFRDVSNDPGCWYRDAVIWAAMNGVTSGDGSTDVFSPNKAITREQMATMIVQFLLNQADQNDAAVQMVKRMDAKTASMFLNGKFKDACSISSWASINVLICKIVGIMGGDTFGTFRPQAGLSRAECAQTFLNLYSIGTKQEVDKEENLPIDYQFKDIDAADADKGQMLKVLAASMTNDPYSSQQWGMKTIGMEAAWKSGLTGKGVRVGIIDTGVSTQTGDIEANRLLAGKSFVDGVDSTEDTMGHGTFVAGIIGATKDNGVSIAGIAPSVTIIPLRTSTDGKSKDILGVSAVYSAVDDFDCDIINISYGSKLPQTGMREALQYAVSKGVIVICAGGNSGDESAFYPAAFPEAIGVGSINKYLEKSSFSHVNDDIFVTAPGENIVSLNLTSGAVREAGGSSYSTPVVTGIAALIREAHPDMTNDQFKEILKMSCWDLGDEGYDTSYGWGLVQAPKAILKAAEYFGTTAPDMPASPDPTPEAKPDPTDDSDSTSHIWDLFNFNWLRELFQSIIRNLFKGWSI